MIRVLKGKIKAFGEYHSIGATIAGLSVLVESRLVENGFAEYVEEKKPPKKAVKKTASPEPKTELVEEKEEEANVAADEKIAFDPDDCIVKETAAPKPKPKKTTAKKPTKKTTKKTTNGK